MSNDCGNCLHDAIESHYNTEKCLECRDGNNWKPVVMAQPKPPPKDYSMYTLGKLILPRELTRDLLNCFRMYFRTFPIPTEVVLYDPKYVPTVRQGRVYSTHFCVRNGVIGMLGDPHPNDGHNKYISLCEVFDDRGEDGHTSMSLVGYRLCIEQEVDYDTGMPDQAQVTDEDCEVLSKEGY